ncbi:mRNA splicing protein [Saccharomycopsis crataegensis]|uniref:mRNA splicing protein n=1 Tax=Saccharomycopsis crataegensis TaxID=43959 RepID=A0AAV5QLP4_9ASCO|nr:mRNA splicing protein [Saccharomycopsis crataegensis]
MSERKSINKYRGNEFYEEDFEKLRKKLKKQQKNNKSGPQLQDVRLMAPFSLKCLNCNEYISKSRKFNAKKETTNERYLGLKIFRFTIRCPRCSNVIKYRTDPKTADYIIESGAVRNYVNKSNDEAERFRNETLEETLERLEKEEAENKAKEEQKKNGNGSVDMNDEATAMEKLEKKLEQSQKEQALSFEIESLLRKNAKNENSRSLGTLADDADIESLAKQAFKNKGSQSKIENVSKLQLLGNPSKVFKTVKKKKKIII